MGKALKVNRGGASNIAGRTFAGSVTTSYDHTLNSSYGYGIRLAYSDFSGFALQSGDLLVKNSGQVFGYCVTSEIRLTAPTDTSNPVAGTYAVLR